MKLWLGVLLDLVVDDWLRKRLVYGYGKTGLGGRGGRTPSPAVVLLRGTDEWNSPALTTESGLADMMRVFNLKLCVICS